MNCEEVRTFLPLAIYGDLDGAQASEVAAHLKACPGCRAEESSLRQARSALDAVAAPQVAVNPVAIIEAESARQVRLARRWRRIAVAATTLAAGFLLVLAIRPQVRVGDGALVVRWTDAPAPASVPQPSLHLVPPASDPGQAERLAVLAKLLRALVDDADGRDRDRQAEIAALRARLDAITLSSEARWQDIQKDMGVLYRQQFPRKEGLE